MSHHDNITRIKAVYNALEDLKDEVVFVGGATVSLYADRRTEETRPTDDIDVIIELGAHKDYAAIDERLRKLGFVNDQESGVICRYIVKGITVDVMPAHDRTLGFLFPHGVTPNRQVNIISSTSSPLHRKSSVFAAGSRDS